LVALVFSLTFVVFTNALARADGIEVTDVIGRKVTVDAPAQRIVLGFYFEDFMAIGGPEAMDRVVGISRAAWEDWRPDNWKAYLKVRPSLDKIADVGEVEVNTFSVEKVLALKPDLVVLGDWQVKGIGSDFQRIVDAHIPVVVVDYHAQTLEKHLLSTRVIGKVLGTEERAEQIAQEYETAITEVQSRIAKANRPKPSIYVELGNKGVAEQGPSYGKYMWGTIADVAGGNNITKDIVATWGAVSPEFVVTAKPDVIVLSGSEWRKIPTGMLMGQGVSAEEARARLRAFLTRPGWASLPAVKSGRVHGVYQGASRTILDYTSTQFIAKALYPDLFADIDPQANYLSFYKRYLPIVPEGTFMVSLQ
jgi:ABC-type Fe3+-hydroxamate transport system substrate-binding protein